MKGKKEREDSREQRRKNSHEKFLDDDNALDHAITCQPDIQKSPEKTLKNSSLWILRTLVTWRFNVADKVRTMDR